MDQAEAALQYVRVWKDEVYEHEKEAIPEPFKFQFYNTDDVEILRRNNGPKKVFGLLWLSHRWMSLLCSVLFNVFLIDHLIIHLDYTVDIKS